MHRGARISIYDRKTSIVSLVIGDGDGGQVPPSAGPTGEDFYVERLLVLLASGWRSSEWAALFGGDNFGSPAPVARGLHRESR
jgi:hypothetical protein